MRNLNLLLIFLLFSVICSAQTNFHHFRIGAGIGVTVAYADLEKKPISLASYGTLNYYFTPFISIGLEVQKGVLNGGNQDTELTRQEFSNSYYAVSGGFKVQLGEFLRGGYNQSLFQELIKGMYVGTGLGIIGNDVNNIRQVGNIYFGGVNKSREYTIPTNLGINFHIPDHWGRKRFVVNVNFQAVLVLGEGLDGYARFVNEPNDIYSFSSVGINYHFGSLGVDRRR